MINFNIVLNVLSKVVMNDYKINLLGKAIRYTN